MSLLLDAMKKAGDRSTGLSGTSPDEQSAAAQPNAASPEASKDSAYRVAGETLFAAKKKKAAPRFHWDLGLVPTTFLICSVLGAGYGYYVWREISPPAQQVVRHPATPQPAARTPAPALPLVASIAPEPAPEMMPPKPEAAPEEVPKPFFSVAKPRPRSAAKPRAPSPPAGMSIELNQASDSITPVLLDAYQAYQRGDYASAAKGYHEVLNKDARNRDAMLGLAAIAQQQEQDEIAQYYYRQVLLLDPRDAFAQGALSAYSTSTGADNESQLKQMISEQPRSSALHYALGNVYAGQSRWADAQQAYFNARMLEPSNAQFTYNLAVSLDHLGQRKSAAQHYRQALQLDTNNNAGFDHAQAQQRLNELTAPGH
jgi:tetratricopeptide (TPR) repeat protein